jgi:hypothetical protein
MLQANDLSSGGTPVAVTLHRLLDLLAVKVVRDLENESRSDPVAEAPLASGRREPGSM